MIHAKSAGFAPAKINLTLHVTGQRDDGYHLLDSLVVFADVGDQLALRPNQSALLTVTGPMAEGVPTDGRNLITRAAELVGADARFALEKHLPAMAGIGGGSADAAAALRLLGQGDLPPDRAAKLGADVPVCLHACAARMAGIGEQVTPVELPPLAAVLVNPRVSVSTPDVFRALPQKTNPAMGEIPVFQSVEQVLDLVASGRNDLQSPAMTICPAVGEVLKAIDGTGAALARMSGSGATCFGLFETHHQARLAADMIAMMHDEWWVTACTLA